MNNLKLLHDYASAPVLRTPKTVINLAEFLKLNASVIISEWLALISRESPVLRKIDDYLLIDSLPKFLQNLALAFSKTNWCLKDMTTFAEEHIQARSSAEDYSLSLIALEFSILRKSIFSVIERSLQISNAERDLILDFLGRGLIDCAHAFTKLQNSKVELLKETAEELLARNNELLNELDAIVWIYENASGKLTFVSEKVHPILGFSKEEVSQEIGFLLKRSHPEDRAMFKLVIDDAIQTGRSQKIEHRMISRSGKVLWFQTSIQVDYSNNGRFPRIKGMCFDITHRKNADILNQDLIEKSNSDNKSLRKQRKLRENFVTTIAHDLRNPLSVAVLYSHMLEDRHEYELDVAKISKDLVRSLLRIDTMVRDLLDANHLQIGQKVALRMEELDLPALIGNVVREMGLLHKNQIIFHEANKAVTGFWSEDGIRRILENLITNAAKYGTEDAPIEISLISLPGAVRLCVSNSGASETTAGLQKLFEPFQRAKRVKKEKPGWGIGLTLVRGIAESHGGLADCKVADGRTTIFVEIPA